MQVSGLYHWLPGWVPTLAASLSVNAARTAAPCDWALVLRQWELLLGRVAGREGP